MSKINLVNQDCLEFLKTVSSKSVSLVLIDPPYQVSRKTNFQAGMAKNKDTDRFRISMEFGDWDKEEFLKLDEVISECYRVLKSSETIICFYDLWKITKLRKIFEDSKFQQIRFIEWIKTNPVPINSKVNYLTNSREIAIVGVKGGKPVFNSEYDNGVYLYPICHDKGRFHPTQKPVALLEDLIKKHSYEDDLILDCFSGSGSTAVACHNLNRSFTRCELSESFYLKILERFNLLGISNDSK